MLRNNLLITTVELFRFIGLCLRLLGPSSSSNFSRDVPFGWGIVVDEADPSELSCGTAREVRLRPDSSIGYFVAAARQECHLPVSHVKKTQ